MMERVEEELSKRLDGDEVLVLSRVLARAVMEAVDDDDYLTDPSELLGVVQYAILAAAHSSALQYLASPDRQAVVQAWWSIRRV